MNCSSCGNNNTLFILLLAFILCGKEVKLSSILNCNTLPLLLILLCCTGKNSPFASIGDGLFGNNCGCGCND